MEFNIEIFDYVAIPKLEGYCVETPCPLCGNSELYPRFTLGGESEAVFVCHSCSSIYHYDAIVEYAKKLNEINK